MSSLILFGANSPKVICDIERLAAAAGARVKSTSDIMICQAWVRDYNPAGIVIAEGVSSRLKLEIASNAWAGGFKGALLTVIEESDAFRHDLSLAGVTLVKPGELLKVIKDLLAVSLSSNVAKRSVLYVEDLDTPRDIICAYLEKLGCIALGVDSVTAALACLRAEPGRFHCVITDINMPKLKGTDLIAAIRADSQLKKLPIVVLTAYGSADCLVESMELGASGFLAKPPRREDLQRELARADRVNRGTRKPKAHRCFRYRATARSNINRAKPGIK